MEFNNPLLKRNTVLMPLEFRIEAARYCMDCLEAGPLTQLILLELMYDDEGLYES